jgi:hypothetical protein
MSHTFSHYPIRFAGESNPLVEAAITGNVDAIFLDVSRDQIIRGDIRPIATIIHDMVSTREKADAFRQRVDVGVRGFDNDPRALWQIGEARLYFRNLFLDCPFVMLLARPTLLKVMLNCWLYDNAPENESLPKRQSDEFFVLAFRGLNDVMYRLAMSEEANREIVYAAFRALYGDECPPEW